MTKTRRRNYIIALITQKGLVYHLFARARTLSFSPPTKYIHALGYGILYMSLKIKELFIFGSCLSSSIIKERLLLGSVNKGNSSLIIKAVFFENQSWV